MIDTKIKDYKELSSDCKIARKTFIKSRCTNCFLYNSKETHLCDAIRFKICINAFTKGFVAGVKHHRNIIKNKKK